MESAQNVVFDKCVYTIVSSDVIRNADSNDSEGHFTERKSWTKALELFKQAELEDKLFLLLLADAAYIRGVEWIAQIIGIDILPDGSTKISFANLHPLEETKLLSDLKLLNTGEALSNSYIRPYALCITPDFVYDNTAKILAYAEDDETATFNHTKQAFLLTWKKGNPPYKFEDFKEIVTWRLRSHKQAKIGDEAYFLKQGKEPRGIFGRGVIIKSPYQIEGTWVVDVKIDEITNPSKSLFLTLETLCHMHPPEGLWFSQTSGIRIPNDVAEAVRSSNRWKINSMAPVTTEPQDVPDTSDTREVEIRIGQQQFREGLLQHWRGCSVTGCLFQEVLIASHIVPWSEASNSERLDVFNGLLLTPNLDKLFDNHFISFNSDGEILISKSLSSKAKSDLGINSSMRLRRTNEKLVSYLLKHEKIFLEKEQARQALKAN